MAATKNRTTSAKTSSLYRSHCTEYVSCFIAVSVVTARGKDKGKFTLEQATEAQRGSTDIALLFLQPRR